MTMMPGLSDDDGKQLVCDILRMFVGQGKRISWAGLAAATRDEERKLRSYVEQDGHAMPHPVFMRVFSALPPEAFAMICARMGFTAPAAREVEESATILSAMSGAAGFVAETAEALEDNSINRTERRRLARRARALIPKLEAVADGED